MKKAISFIALLLVMTLVFTGCSSNDSQVNTDNEESKKVRVEFATWAGGGELQELQEIVDALNAESNEYEIEVISIPADYYTKLQTMIAGNDAPDLMWLSQEYIPAYAELGAIEDITTYAKNDSSIDLNDFYVPTLATAKWKDKLYGFPWIAQPVIMYYNKDLFDEAGLDYPEDITWDEFIEMGKKLTKDTDGDGKIDQYGFIVNGWPPIHTWLWTYGGGDVDENGNVIIDTPESKKALEVLYDILHVSKITPSKTQIEAQGFGEQFKAGKIATFMGGAGDDFEKTVDFNVGTTVIPYGTERATFNWIASTVMSSQAENKEVVYKALSDLTNKFFDWKVVPPVKSKFGKITENRPDKESALPAIKASMEFARGFNNMPKQNEIAGKVWDNLYDPLLRNDDNFDLDTAIEETAKALRELLAK
ncbi:hypothetical protein BHF71_09790 [Vulcanibacillus modesticaldus]|uniref:ABC transporter substrate-binding protein n=1 Tax=Vulcanibacillus modesticaldus TaxID=337097 RepID=A0A1D2YU44_9BACI|nr:sugar ABC transporter substrate-binding protein [Vulcanibacillus modesticaldus]OEF99165.1 hypothetical protein BHF71_09790 [Vulcanibacillus modesticaldus]